MATDARARAWRPAWPCGVCSLVLAWLGACSLDTSGLGSSGAMPGGEGDASSAGELEPSTGVGTDPADGGATMATMTAPSGGADEAPEPTSGPDGDDTTSGPGVDPCESPAPFTIQIDVTQALLSGPMQLDESAAEGPYAYSELAGQGRASFEFQVPCQAEFRAWGRVYDPGVGLDALDIAEPDSFLVAFDGEDDTQWWYGCQMVDAGPYGGAWSWERMMDNPACLGEELRRTLSPGTHLLHLTNREAGTHLTYDTAAVARVVITSDPSYAP